MPNFTLSRQAGELSSASSRSLGEAWADALLNAVGFPLNSVYTVTIGSNPCPLLSVKTGINHRIRCDKHINRDLVHGAGSAVLWDKACLEINGFALRN